MTHLRRSLLPLAMAMLVALVAVSCTADAAHEQSQSAVAEGFEPATHPPAWDQGQRTLHTASGAGQAGETDRWPIGGQLHSQ